MITYILDLARGLRLWMQGMRWYGICMGTVRGLVTCLRLEPLP